MAKFSVKKMLLSVAAVASVAALSIAGTVAYLQDTDSDVNVMTLGNVSIEQNEYQRETNDDGSFKTDNNGYVLEDFEQAKPLYPATELDANGNPANHGAGGWDATQIDFSQIDSVGSAQVFTSENAQDKIVTVKNTGKSDAYVRTWIALEDPFTENRIGVNTGASKYFIQSPVWESMEIDGVKYSVSCFTYKEALKPGEVSHPSLIQVYLNSLATNEDMELLGDTYDILAFSQAVQAKGFDSAEIALAAAFGTNHPWTDDVVLPIIINDEEELEDLLTDLTDAGSGSNTVYIADDIDASDIDWTPIKVEGYHGAGIITIEGQGKTITGLDAPLFAGGFAGKSGIVIKDLTIADSDIVSTNTLGSGAFIESVDSMQKIVLDNCHLKDSTVTGGNGSRTGGLIGWTAGYNNVNDGPVKTYVTITNCTVDNCTITSNGSVGGIYGHAGNNAWTYSTVENCAVTNCKLNSTDAGGWRVGVVVGTANVGELTISGITESGNTLTQTGKTAPAGQSNLYGRFVPDTTGKLIINGVAVN